MAIKQNCWEFMKCGREQGGARVAMLGVCPAAADISANGLNNGKNAGRICWAIVGTFCGGKIQGTFAQKKRSCLKCEFFKMVKQDEGKEFALLEQTQYRELYKKASIIKKEGRDGDV